MKPDSFLLSLLISYSRLLDYTFQQLFHGIGHLRPSIFPFKDIQCHIQRTDGLQLLVGSGDNAACLFCGSIAAMRARRTAFPFNASSILYL